MAVPNGSPAYIGEEILKNYKVSWEVFPGWTHEEAKKSLLEEFDLEGKEQISIKSQLVEIGRNKLKRS